MVICIGNPYFMTEITKTFETANITDQLRQLSLSDISRLSEEKKTELLTAINSKLETLKKDKKNGNIAKAGTELRQILYDVRRLDLQKLIEKSETVQEVKSQLAALEGVENSLNTSDKAREAMWKMKISDDSPEGTGMEPGEIINAQKWWDISKALNGLDLNTATSEQLPALLNIIENISDTRYDLVYKEGWKIDSIAKEEGGPEKYLNVYSEFKNTFARLRNEADTNALKTIDLHGIKDDPKINDKLYGALDTIQYDYQLKDGLLTRTNKTSKITDYRNDVANIWETSQERDARLAQEKIKEEEPGKIADIIGGEHATGDSIDAPGHWLDPAYSYKRTENSITRTKDGKTDIWDTESKKWSTEADETARIAKENETIEGTNEYKEKMRTIFEEMRSNPDVYSENDAWKETYEFNGQQLSLEWEEPNQYLTRVVDGKTEQFDIETGEWSINETESKNGFFVTDKSGAKIELKKGEMREVDGSNFFVTEDGQTIAIRKKDTVGRDKITEYYQVLQDGKWVDLKTENLSQKDQSQLFLAQYGDWGMPDNLDFKNTKIANIDSMLSYQTNVNFRSFAWDFLRKLQKDLDKSPGMGRLTLGEYNDFNKNPDSFATSEFVPERINLQFTDPEYYGIETKWYEYARETGGSVIKRPKVGANMDNTMVSTNGKDFESQRSWLEKNIAKIETDTPTNHHEYVVLGSENLRFSKQGNGDVYVFNKWEPDNKIDTYAQGKWEKVWGKV